MDIEFVIAINQYSSTNENPMRATYLQALLCMPVCEEILTLFIYSSAIGPGRIIIVGI